MPKQRVEYKNKNKKQRQKNIFEYNNIYSRHEFKYINSQFKHDLNNN